MTGTPYEHPTAGVRALARLLSVALLSCAVVAVARPVEARPPEQNCRQVRYEASAKYLACEQRIFAKLFGGEDAYEIAGFDAPLAKCRLKLAATWTKIHAAAIGTGTTCDHARFEDNGDGTVTDWLTELVWEKKHNQDTADDLGDPHDADNSYSWDATAGMGDGRAYTMLLAQLNGGTCFAGHCDWRVPTIYELQTIMPCSVDSCASPSVLGPGGISYWSSTTFVGDPLIAGWLAMFTQDRITNATKLDSGHVRAVRSGL